MKKQTAFQKWEKRCKKELEFFMNTFEGNEIQLNLLAQGYKEILIEKLMGFFGSGFIVSKIIKDLEKEVGE